MIWGKRCKLVKILTCMLFAILFIGWSGDWERLRKESRDVETIGADFVQEKHLRILSRPLISKGIFYFQSPRSLRWEYRSPIKSILLMHDGKIARYVGGEGGFKEKSGPGLKAMQVVLQEITRWLKGHFDDNPNFTATLERGGKIVLTPKQGPFSAMIKRIEIRLSDRGGVIETVKIYEGEDSFTLIKFENVRINGPLNASLFQEIR